MINLTLARRYARALADILFAARLSPAQQKTEVEKAKRDLVAFAALLREQVPLRNTLASPAVSREKKLAVLDRLKGLLGLSPTTRNFLAVLLDNRRLPIFDDVLAAFDREVYARLGILPAEITIAVALNPKQKKQAEDRLAALTGSQVEVRFDENAEILAGAVARLGSTIYDGSLRGQLRRMQQQLTQG